MTDKEIIDLYLSRDECAITATKAQYGKRIRKNKKEIWTHYCLVPPEGFSPLTATDEELARYCFPPIPTDEAQLKQWENQMKYYKSTPAPKVDDTVEIRYPDND